MGSTTLDWTSQRFILMIMRKCILIEARRNRPTFTIEARRNRATFIIDTVLIAIVVGLVTGCSGRRVHGDVEPAEQADPKEQRLENMITAISRAQSRIEELDAKVSA